MCGIGAVFGYGLKDGGSLIMKSLEAVRHRGHSLFETAVFDDCALGANRLEIVDRDSAKQPQSNEDGTLFAVLNGEIYNHDALRAELGKKGHIFRTVSDTEVLAHLYEEHGPGMVKMLDSEMFAFFIYDKGRNSFFSARDRYGVKPLYYARDSSGNWHFASEMKQLVQFTDIREIHDFPPGHYMLGGKLERYHTMPAPEDVMDDSVASIVQNLRRLFDEAVRKRLDTDLPVAVFFSGGLDSAAVLASARKYKDVTAITVGRPDSPDMLAARRYCDESGVPLISFHPPDAEKLAAMIPEVVRITESFEPNLVRHGALSLFAAKLARENGFRVVLCGEGSDELFAGYEVFGQSRGLHLSYLLHHGIKRLPYVVFQRVDRTSMFHTVEVRLPFFDTEFADYAMRIPGGLKLRDSGGRRVAKWVLREAMKDRLPRYIVERQKMPFTSGAGCDVGGDGRPFSEIMGRMLSDAEFGRMKAECASWNIAGREAAYYFRLFDECLYTKAGFARNRPTYGILRHPMRAVAGYIIPHLAWRISSIRRPA